VDNVTAPRITHRPNGVVVLTFPYSADLVAALKTRIPAYARRYDPDSHAWTVISSHADVATRLMLDVSPDVETVGVAAPDRGRPSSDDPWVILHLQPTAPLELVTAAHRCLAKLNHPDRGGDTSTMQRINRAADQIRSQES